MKDIKGKVILQMKDKVRCIAFHEILTASFNDEIEIVSTVDSLKGLEVACSVINPDMIIIELGKSADLCFSSIRKIASFMPSTKIIAMGNVFDGGVVVDLAAHGACGYFAKTDSRIRFLDLVKRVLELNRAQAGYPFQMSIQ
jgi:DNA-binding NarL/FixJ family response regulator